MQKQFFNKIIESAHYAYALHKIILNDNEPYNAAMIIHSFDLNFHLIDL